MNPLRVCLPSRMLIRPALRTVSVRDRWLSTANASVASEDEVHSIASEGISEDVKTVEINDAPDASGRKLNLILADSQLFSRRSAESLIQQRRVTVAGKVVSRPQERINDYDSNQIEIDGVPLRAKYNTTWPRLWAVQKFVGEIMSDRDPNKSRPIFLDRIHNKVLPKIFHEYGPLKPVFRLGYNVEGLVLVTNSGELAKLLSNHPTDPLVLKMKVRVHGIMNDGKLHALENGVFVDDKRYFAKSAKRLPPFDKTNSWLELGVTNFHKDPKAVEVMLKKMYLQPSRFISIGFGPFDAQKIFNPSSDARHSVSVREMIEQNQRTEGVNAVVKEVHLPPSLHATVLRHMNNRHVIQPHHLNRPRPSASSA